ncbi:hypothetical protein RclHR1_01480008 [Rhizophagus clarus]|uniref:F-box domain-containing protein n=1 Tax=Rhizophagus clarus TaxID=94130 RepID=A0A2Z6QDK0_9GLOM|nr:hypothetical protein RclHR1_01480008 [Rhizophagus clarus]
MTPQLNFDCLNQIFKFINEDDSTLLYSPSLVNKLWCQVAIPFLWSNPWKFKNRTNVNLQWKRNILIKTYLSCLYQESREILINEDFFKELFSILNEHSSSQETIKINRNDKNLLINNIQNRPMFVYPEFLRHLKLNSLVYAVKFWSNFNLSGSHRETVYTIALVEMINYLFKKSTCLFTLDIRYCDGEHFQSLQILAHLLEMSNGNIKSLLELKTFEYDPGTIDRIFKALSITSQNIKRMPIYPDTVIDDLTKLIKVQKNLSEVTITHGSYDLWMNYDWKESDVTNIIIERANLITCLILEDIYFPLSFLSSFVNLKELFLKSISINFKENWNPLSEIILPNLQIFHFEPKNSDMKLISKFIHNNSLELIQIKIKCENIENPFLTKDLFIIMTNYCQNLTIYEGPIISIATNELKEFLKSCKNLLTLHLHSINNNNLNYENFDNLLNEISIIIPKKLTTLIINGRWTITSNSLEIFLKSRENLFLRKINFYWGSLVNYEGKFRYICSKYRKKGIVDKYGDF